VARGDRVEIGELDARLDQRLGHDRRDELHVCAARDLGHHPAEARVQVDWLDTTDDHTVRPSSTTAAAVSSHDVSMPRMSVTSASRRR